MTRFLSNDLRSNSLSPNVMIPIPCDVYQCWSYKVGMLGDDYSYFIVRFWINPHSLMSAMLTCRTNDYTRFASITVTFSAPIGFSYPFIHRDILWISCLIDITTVWAFVNIWTATDRTFSLILPLH